MVNYYSSQSSLIKSVSCIAYAVLFVLMAFAFSNAQPCPVLDGGTRYFWFTGTENNRFFFPATLPAGKSGDPHCTAGRFVTEEPKNAVYPLRTVTINPEFTDGTVGRAVLRFDLLDMSGTSATIKVYPGTLATGVPAEVINSTNASSYLLQTRVYNGPVTVTFESPTAGSSGDFNVRITYTTGDQVVTSPFGFQVAYWTNFITPNSYIALENYPDWAVPIATAYFNDSKQLVSSQISFCTDYGEDAPSIGNANYPGEFVFHPTARPDYNENGTVEPIDAIVAARMVYILSHAPQPISDFANFMAVQSAIDATNINPNIKYAGLAGEAYDAIQSLPSPIEPDFSIAGPGTSVPAGIAQNFVVDLTNDGGHVRVFRLEVPAGVTINSVTGSGVTYDSVNKTITFASSPATATVSVTSAVAGAATVRVVYDQPNFWNVNNLIVYEPCDSYPKSAYQGFLGISNGESPKPFREASATWLEAPEVPAFVCSDSQILYSGSPGGTTTLYDVNYSSNPLTRTPIGASAASIYNAIGFNPVDGLVYGILSELGANSNHLIRIDSTGSVVDLGAVTGLPVQNTTEYNAGDFDNAGFLYVMHNNSSSIYKIDVINKTSTATSLSPATAISLSDVAYHNGLFYGVRNSNSQLVSIDPATGAVTDIGTAFGTGVFGALMGGCNGIFGIANNGGFYQFDITTGTRAKLADTPSALSGVDGAHCHTACIDTAPLPVKLVGFTAVSEGSAASLTWSTTEEVNSSYFGIEHSGDAKSWTTLSTVKSYGESVIKRDYHYTHTMLSAGINYYRLKMVDLDGTFAYSQIRSLRNDQSVSNLKAYPNPVVNGKLSIDISGTGSYQAEVYSLSGVRVMQYNLGTNRELNVATLGAGMYVLHIKSATGDVHTRTFVVK
ncbi:MAG: T9SS type A sorting domain-containing protein [Dyadobacter sp.]|uniref:T9SS type A sorting domain-containing protein n=1 Tax=Dyadobacter sp. TaxID=1914288 RepID=UPI001AFF9497|nr:T9SS type A sorting domain-containing protein [Dyadobacter sp.]MBO9611402.1 T9SS type A sorting domain-containing protein [Dyadobacter sp.]